MNPPPPPKARWHYMQDQQQRGSVTDSQLRALAEKGDHSANGSDLAGGDVRMGRGAAAGRLVSPRACSHRTALAARIASAFTPTRRERGRGTAQTAAEEATETVELARHWRGCSRPMRPGAGLRCCRSVLPVRAADRAAVRGADRLQQRRVVLHTSRSQSRSGATVRLPREVWVLQRRLEECSDRQVRGGGIRSAEIHLCDDRFNTLKTVVNPAVN